MKDHVLPGQGMQWAGDGCEILHIPSVIPGETKEGAGFGGGFGGWNLPDGSKER